MMNHHVLTAIKGALNYYLQPANQPAFLALFDDTAHDDVFLTSVLTELRETPPQLRPYAQAGTAKLPLIVSQLLGRTVRERPLGHSFDGKENGISNQSCRVDILSKGVERTEVLSLLIYKIIMQAKADFLENGYIYFSLNSIDELTPQEELTAEEMGVYFRRIELEAMIHEGSPRLGNWDQEIGTLQKPSLTQEGGRVQLNTEL